MAALAARPNVVCKLSGLVTEAAQDWSLDDLRPYADHLLEVFGPERLLFGSDWPVVNRAGGYDRWREAALALVAPLSETERRRDPRRQRRADLSASAAHLASAPGGVKHDRVIEPGR